MVLRFLGLAVLLVLASCASGGSNNIQWLRDSNISVIELPADVDDLVRGTKRVSENSLLILELSHQDYSELVKAHNSKNPGSKLDATTNPCFFKPPNFIVVKKGIYDRAQFGGVLIRESYREYCLDHETGHFREHREGVPRGTYTTGH